MARKPSEFARLGREIQQERKALGLRPAKLSAKKYDTVEKRKRELSYLLPNVKLPARTEHFMLDDRFIQKPEKKSRLKRIPMYDGNTGKILFYLFAGFMIGKYK